MTGMDLKNSESGPALFLGLDPRVLLLAATGAAICFSLIRTMPVAWACLFLAVILVAAGRPRLPLVLKRLAVANVFIAFLWLTVPLTVPGENAGTLGPFSLSREGVALALSTTVKCNAILLVFLVLVADMSLPLVGAALDRLRVPPKLVFLFLCTCRYVHVIGEEWQRLRTAARLRGFAPSTSMHTYRTIGNMLGLTVVNSLDRSRRIYEAMLLRGFRGTFHTVTDLTTARRDIAFTAAFFCILACLLLVDLRLGYFHA